MSEQMLWSVYVFRKGASDYSIEAVFNLRSDAVKCYEELAESKKFGVVVEPFEESLLWLISTAVDSRLRPVQSVVEGLAEAVDKQSKAVAEAIEEAKDTWY